MKTNLTNKKAQKTSEQTELELSLIKQAKSAALQEWVDPV